jgi:hypothetical protein
MPNKIERLNVITQPILVTASAATTGKAQFGPAAGGMFIVDALAGGANTLTWHASFGAEEQPVPVNDGTSDVTTSVTANKTYPIPDALFGAPFVAVVTNAGTATIRLCVKG